LFLIAEDDGINFMLLKKIQSKKPYSYQGQNGQEAVDICANNPNISVVFMDIRIIKWF
jgi:CheY-like chemotaxis protein